MGNDETKKNLEIGAYYPDRRQKIQYKTAKKNKIARNILFV